MMTLVTVGTLLTLMCVAIGLVLAFWPNTTEF